MLDKAKVCYLFYLTCSLFLSSFFICMVRIFVQNSAYFHIQVWHVAAFLSKSLRALLTAEAWKEFKSHFAAFDELQVKVGNLLWT